MDIDDDIVEQLLEWDDMLAEGDRSFDTDAIALLKDAEPAEDDHLFFHAPCSLAAVRLAQDAGVSFAVRNTSGESPLFETDLYPPRAYAAVAADVAAQGGLDWADEEGFTALSVQVKFGQVENARALLDLGASPNAYAKVARYGDSPMTIAMQAVNAVSDAADTEAVSIALLRLLLSHGAEIGPAHKARLLERAADRPRLTEWIEEHV